MLSDRGEIEHVSRLETPTAIEHLFCNNFCRSFKRDSVTSYIGRCGRVEQDIVAANEVDFAQLLIRSEEHTSELQSLMRISYAVFCLKKKKKPKTKDTYC